MSLPMAQNSKQMIIVIMRLSLFPRCLKIKAKCLKCNPAIFILQPANYQLQGFVEFIGNLLYLKAIFCRDFGINNTYTLEASFGSY